MLICPGLSSCRVGGAVHAAVRPSGAAAFCRPHSREYRFEGRAIAILNLRSPAGIDRRQERDFYDAVGTLNRARLEATGDPEIMTRVNAYEMAYRMQTSARS
jgi:hypothetical protein